MLKFAPTPVQNLTLPPDENLTFAGALFGNARLRTAARAIRRSPVDRSLAAEQRESHVGSCANVEACLQQPI